MIQVQNSVPTQHAELFGSYVECLKAKCDTILWVVLDYGHQIEMLDKEKHVERVSAFLNSGDERRVKVAIEVMRRNLGTWKER